MDHRATEKTVQSMSKQVQIHATVSDVLIGVMAVTIMGLVLGILLARNTAPATTCDRPWLEAARLDSIEQSGRDDALHCWSDGSCQ